MQPSPQDSVRMTPGLVRSRVNVLFELNDDYTLTESMNHYTYDAASILEQKCGKSSQGLAGKQ